MYGTQHPCPAVLPVSHREDWTGGRGQVHNNFEDFLKRKGVNNTVPNVVKMIIQVVELPWHHWEQWTHGVMPHLRVFIYLAKPRSVNLDGCATSWYLNRYCMFVVLLSVKSDVKRSRSKSHWHLLCKWDQNKPSRLTERSTNNKKKKETCPAIGQTCKIQFVQVREWLEGALYLSQIEPTEWVNSGSRGVAEGCCDDALLMAYLFWDDSGRAPPKISVVARKKGKEDKLKLNKNKCFIKTVGMKYTRLILSKKKERKWE